MASSVQAGRVVVTRKGVRSARLRDLYHWLMARSWPAFLGVMAGGFVVLNLLFAVAYSLGGACIAEARPGSLVDGFFFSVQTMATIGYGHWYPETAYAHVLVSMEAIVGILGTAVATGLCFARFARPTARVLFSRTAVVSPRDGVPCLMARVANERTNQIVEASVRMVLSRVEKTREGKRVRRMIDLTLERDQNPLFALTWTIVHPIGPQSPLYGHSKESLAEADAILLVSLVGLDETVSQTVHAHRAYSVDDVIWGARFADILSYHRADGVGEVDLHHFHEVVPVDRQGRDSGASLDVWV